MKSIAARTHMPGLSRLPSKIRFSKKGKASSKVILGSGTVLHTLFRVFAYLVNGLVTDKYMRSLRALQSKYSFGSSLLFFFLSFAF